MLRVYQNKLLRLVGEQFLLAGFATPAMAISGFLIRKKIPVKYVSCRCFRKALAGLRIRKSAPYLRRISNPSQRKPLRACGFGNPHLICAGFQIRRSVGDCGAGMPHLLLSPVFVGDFPMPWAAFRAFFEGWNVPFRGG